MNEVKDGAEKYRQSSKMISTTKECSIIEVKLAYEYGCAIEKKV